MIYCFSVLITQHCEDDYTRIGHIAGICSAESETAARAEALRSAAEMAPQGDWSYHVNLTDATDVVHEFTPATLELVRENERLREIIRSLT